VDIETQLEGVSIKPDGRRSLDPWHLVDPTIYPHNKTDPEDPRTLTLLLARGVGSAFFNDGLA
jgi:hypothetical protein